MLDSSARFWTALVALIGVAVTLLGCSGRPYVQPRSTVISEARKAGVPMASVEEERELFFSRERAHQRRLLTLLKRRTGGARAGSGYILGPGDEIELNVFDVPELNVTARVRDSGFITLPLIGAVRVAGRTESDLTDELSNRLATFVRSPQVSVFVSDYGSQKVTVVGAVNRPGSYPLKKGANSFVDVIGEAGGVTAKAGNYLNFVPAELTGADRARDTDRAQLVMASDELANLDANGIELYLDQVLGTSGNIPLELPVRGGDMIIIPEAGKVMLEGEVKRPGQVELGQQMTLLGALAAAGGITYSAKVDEIEVIREIGLDKKAHLVLDLTRIARGEERDVRLRNGDLVRIPSDPGRRMTQDTFDALGGVINFGVGGNVSVVP